MQRMQTACTDMMADPEESVLEISLDNDPASGSNDSDYVPNSDQEEAMEDDLDEDLMQMVANIQENVSRTRDNNSFDLLPEVSDSGEGSDDDMDGDEYLDDNVPIPADEAEEHPDRVMNLVHLPQEYDIDYNNGWIQLEDSDPGYDHGHPPFLGAMITSVQGTAPMDFFNFLFKESMWGEIALQTNEYAQRQLEKQGTDVIARMDNPLYKRHARLNSWKPVLAEDIRVFAAHLILMGLLKKPELEEYWSRKTLTRTPFFGQFMSRDHFQMILSNFHLTDDRNNPPRGHPGHKPLAKLQPMIDMIGPAFKSAYKPGKNISVDEGCCPWKGKLNFRMFNPRKPHKFHVKLFQVSDPMNGYVLHFSIYTGKGSCYEEGHTSNDREHSITTKTVMTMCAHAGILDKGHHVYFDNYFTSPQLLEELHCHDTLACGTARARTSGPQALQAKSPKLLLYKGESCALRSGPILAFKWVENKPNQKKEKPKQVYMMSTIHTAMEMFTGKSRHEGNEPIYKPVAIIEYTKLMGGVDLSDQLMNYYHFLRRGCKWW